MNNEGKMEEAPEWDIFKRLEKLEVIELTSSDVRGLAVMAFALSFYNTARADFLRDNPRRLKDWVVAELEKFVGSETLRVLEELMLSACETIEKEEMIRREYK